VVITVGDTTMRKILTLVLFASLIVPSAAIAEKPKHRAVRIGLVLLHGWEARVSGPQSVLVHWYRIVPINDDFHWGSLGTEFYGGLRLKKMTLGVSYVLYGTMTKPVASFLNILGDFSGCELSVRYELLRRKPFSFYAVGSLARLNPYQEKWLYEGYDLNEPFFLPGLGVGANVSIVHAEVRFHKWPGLKVGEVVEPGPPRLPSGYDYTLKPLRLNYAVSFLCRLEFTVFKF